MNIGWLFAPGWGMDWRFFEPLIEALPAGPIAFYERPYYRDVAEPELSEDTLWVGIGHSYGYARLAHLHEKRPLSALISLCGFLKFVQDSDFPWGAPMEELDAFIASVEAHPADTLVAFYKKCGLDSLKIPQNFNQNVLLEDLRALKSLNIKDIPFPTYAIGATKDRIVTPEHFKNSFSKASKLLMIDANHSLGFEKSQSCAEKITRVLGASCSTKEE